MLCLLASTTGFGFLHNHLSIHLPQHPLQKSELIRRYITCSRSSKANLLLGAAPSSVIGGSPSLCQAGWISEWVSVTFFFFLHEKQELFAATSSSSSETDLWACEASSILFFGRQQKTRFKQEQHLFWLTSTGSGSGPASKGASPRGSKTVDGVSNCSWALFFFLQQFIFFQQDTFSSTISSWRTGSVDPEDDGLFRQHFDLQQRLHGIHSLEQHMQHLLFAFSSSSVSSSEILRNSWLPDLKR